MTERMKTWIKGFAGGVAVTVIVGGIGYFICFGSVPMIGEQGLSLSDLGKASKIAKLVDTYYLDYKEGDEDSQYTMEEGMYSGLVASLQDPYSSYYSEDAYKLLQESTQGAVYRCGTYDVQGSGQRSCQCGGSGRRRPGRAGRDSERRYPDGSGWKGYY